MKSKYHVVIVGSGIGGLSAAHVLAGNGLDILMIDENFHSGGQLLRKSETSSSRILKFNPDFIKTKGFSLVHKISDSGNGIDIVDQSQVLGIFKDRRLLIHVAAPNGRNDQKSGYLLEIQAEILILATGAREKYLPFKGWTLPGVMSLGAAQILMKSHGVLPGFHTLIAGNSPLMLALASQITGSQGNVLAILDENAFSRKLSFLPLIQHHWPKFLEGAFYTSQMMAKRVPMMNLTRVIEARGKEKLKSVVVAKTTPEGHVIDGSQTEYKTDSLAIGYGFVPNIELAVQAGCDIRYQKAMGGWIVSCNKNLESSIDSIYAVGEITGIAGAKKSYIQGKIAANSILKAFNKLNFKKHGALLSKKMSALYSLNDKQRDYGAFLNHLCQLPAAAYQQIPDDTIICRCENITMKTIKNAIQLGFVTSSGIKKATRSSMGRCQGRICGAIILDIIMAFTEKTPVEIGPSLTRAPVKNIAINSFLNQPY